jgi:hypothetical protein
MHAPQANDAAPHTTPPNPRSLAPDGARALPLLVTVAVDAIELAHPVTLTRDAACRGQVVFTGGSSLDIRMELLQVRAECAGVCRCACVRAGRSRRHTVPHGAAWLHASLRLLLPSAHAPLHATNTRSRTRRRPAWWRSSPSCCWTPPPTGPRPCRPSHHRLSRCVARTCMSCG